MRGRSCIRPRASFAFISSTLGSSANKLCLGEGLRGSDIGCPTYAPYVSNSGAVGISTSTPQTKLDVNGEIRVSSSSIACSANVTGGAVRYVSGTGLQLCGGNNTWTTIGTGGSGVSAGPSSSVIAFHVTNGGTNQTVTTGAAVPVTWSTEVLDTNNNFGSNQFTATVPGLYQLSTTVDCTDATGYCVAYLLRNGSVVYEGRTNGNIGERNTTASGIMYLNIGDYVSVQVYNGGGTTVHGGATLSYFTGFLLGGGSGGTANPTGISGSIQFNSAGAFAGRSDIIVDPTGSVGIGTGTPKAALDVSGTVRM